MGYINKASYRVGKVKVGVSIIVRKIRFLVILILVLVLTKLFLRR